MRLPFTACLVLLALTGCARAPVAATVAAPAAMAVRAASDLDLATALARFSAAEGRKVTANHIAPNNGHAGATLAVPLTAKERSMLVQLYRLNPQNSDPKTWPAGLLDRAADHLAVLHHFQLPNDAAIDAATMKATLKPRQYLDGTGKVWAYEAFLPGSGYRLAGKYDLKGRLLQVDMDTWQPAPSTTGH